ncbi:MAG: antibiotic biosynthesis monooxygenase [Bacteroidetes bacterium]|nr:antibiotic biosynthesis monooxygenase [Bacteroidota bacterium]MDA0943346.1 antibiotic biosynthesis monooxygenase [Bacteroidota bacterium]MDA1111040.1 antibiotic biosynthesis monooxygenase [Bacteroidota bacterium]
MHFQSEKVERFIAAFDQSKEAIRMSPGCLSLRLLRDPADPCSIQTLSTWEKAEDLERYRHSQLFEDTWAKTKVLFDEKPRAYSYELLRELL